MQQIRCNVFLIGHICIKDKNHQMSLKGLHTNHLIHQVVIIS
jgi:hypothetical protein